MARRPRIGILFGDPSGIGPELAVKLLARPANVERAECIIMADPAVLALGEKVAGVALDPTRADTIQGAHCSPGRTAFVAHEGIPASQIEVGKMTVASGKSVLKGLALAGQAVKAGHIDGILFAPLNKGAMRLAGLTHEDELRYYADLLDVTGTTSEFNITGKLWTSRVTSHIPLKDVAGEISVDKVCAAIRIVHDNQRAAGVDKPRIAVAGLNPHAGDGGTMGTEEIEIIAPAVEKMQAAGIDARGPFAADTIFVAARRGDYDAVVSMYHDQGQIAMKLMGFDSGVTLLGGLPVPITTCASGSAFDIAGKGIAQPEALQAAFDIVTRMAAARIS
jgi:4-hydroxythreonine-4-phosphate dehydrogenase